MSGAGIDGGWYTDVTTFARDTHWLNGLMSAYTTAGVVLLGALLVWAWWGARRGGVMTMGRLVAVLVGIGTAIVANELVKSAIAERRPCLSIPHSYTVVACPGPSDYAFPSNHSAIAAALATGLVLLNRRLGLVAWLLALAEGFSRVYLGVHYPHDVIAGLALGALVTLAVERLLYTPATRLVVRLEHTRLRPLLTSTPQPTP